MITRFCRKILGSSVASLIAQIALPSESNFPFVNCVYHHFISQQLTQKLLLLIKHPSDPS